MAQSPHLEDFDTPGKVTPEKKPKTPKKKKESDTTFHPRRAAIGCGGVGLVLLLGLTLTMVGGLAAGDATIASFGFDPSSFKRWTISLVNFFFGSIAITLFIFMVLRFVSALLAPKPEVRRPALVQLGAFTLATLVWLGLWVTAYAAIVRFAENASAVKIEILAFDPADTLSDRPLSTLNLTSPISLRFSADLIERRFAATHKIVSYEWDKDGNGEIDATGKNVTLDFQHGGQNKFFTTSLVLRLQPLGTEGSIETRQFTKTVSIANEEMYGQIEADPVSGEVPLRVRLNARGITDPTGGRITNYAWDVDADGQPDFDGPLFANVEHVFETIGDHRVAVTVTSSDFADDGVSREKKTFYRTISVYEPAQLRNANAVIKAVPNSGVAPLSVSFDATESGQYAGSRPEKFEWIINDGADSFSGSRATYTFKRPGTYTVALRVFYASGQERVDTTTITVSHIAKAPTAVITSSPPPATDTGVITGNAPLTVNFDANASRDADDNIVSYEWDFNNDGVIDAEGSTTSFTYAEKGDYTARLNITDADGLSSKATVQVRAGEKLPVISFGPSALSGPAPFTVSFDASGSQLPGTDIISYSWQFPGKDTVFLSRSQIAHTFTAMGQQPVVLTVFGADGRKVSDVLTVVVTAPTLTPRISASRLTGPAPLAVQFSASSSQGPEDSTFSWSFGDGATGTGLDIAHVFEEPGVYPVTLTMRHSSGQITTATTVITVER